MQVEVNVDFAAQEPAGPTGRGRRKPVPTTKMDNYTQTRDKDRRTAERRQATIVQKRKVATVSTSAGAAASLAIRRAPSVTSLNAPIVSSPTSHTSNNVQQPISLLTGGHLPSPSTATITPAPADIMDPSQLVLTTEQLAVLSYHLNSSQGGLGGVMTQGNVPSLTDELFADELNNFGDHLEHDYEEAGDYIEEGSTDADLFAADLSSVRQPALSHITVSGDLLHPIQAPLVPESRTGLVSRAADYRPQGAAFISNKTVAKAASSTQEKRAHLQTSKRNKENAPDGGQSGDEHEGDPPSLGTDEQSDGPSDENNSEALTDEELNRRQKKRKITRGDQLGNRMRMRLTEGAYPFMRVRIACEHGFPNDDLRSLFARESFADSFQDFVQRGYNLQGTPSTIALEEADLIEGRIPQTRGDLRKITRDNLTRFFLFKHPGAQSREMTMAQNRTLYATLTEKDAFIYKDPDNIGLPNTVYRHAMIEYCIIEMWFSNEGDLGAKYRSFFDADGKLPLQCVALVITAIRYALDEWKSGMRKGGRSGIKFTDKDYAAVYEGHLTALRSWQTYTSAPGRSNATAQWQKELLDNALAHTGVTVAVNASSQTSKSLTDAVWANNDG